MKVSSYIQLFNFCSTRSQSQEADSNFLELLIKISIKMTELLVCATVYLNMWSFSLHHSETDPSQTFSEFHPLFMSLIVCHPESLNWMKSACDPHGEMQLEGNKTETSIRIFQGVSIISGLGSLMVFHCNCYDVRMSVRPNGL